MTPSDLLADSFERIVASARAVVADLDVEQLATRPSADTNSIAWLVWHFTRVQDDHIANVAGTEQVHTAQGFADRFALPLDVADIGFDHTADQVALVRASGADLIAYLEATHTATLAYLRSIGPADLDRVVDTRWDPPVTLGVRLVSVVNDGTQHVGQAAFLRGLVAPEPPRPEGF